MTLIAKTIVRGGGRNYAQYLQNPKNEQVRVHRIEGTANPHSLDDSLTEMSAYERFTKSHQGLVEVIVNPSFDHPITEWDAVIECVARHAQLEKQAYAAVIHTYQGKDHMHLVFSRYDHDNERMLNLSHINLKVKEARLELELTLGHEHLLSWQEKKAQKEAEQQLVAEREAKRQELLADEEKQRQAKKMTQFVLNSIDLDQKKQEMAARFARSRKQYEEQQEDEEQRLKI